MAVEQGKTQVDSSISRNGTKFEWHCYVEHIYGISKCRREGTCFTREFLVASFEYLNIDTRFN